MTSHLQQPMLGVMARKLRLQYEGAIYHVMNRCDHQEALLSQRRRPRTLSLKTLGKACEKTDWQVPRWCLMNNHFQLLLETPKA